MRTKYFVTCKRVYRWMDIGCGWIACEMIEIAFTFAKASARCKYGAHYEYVNGPLPQMVFAQIKFIIIELKINNNKQSIQRFLDPNSNDKSLHGENTFNEIVSLVPCFGWREW